MVSKGRSNHRTVKLEENSPTGPPELNELHSSRVVLTGLIAKVGDYEIYTGNGRPVLILKCKAHSGEFLRLEKLRRIRNTCSMKDNVGK